MARYRNSVVGSYPRPTQAADTMKKPTLSEAETDGMVRWAALISVLGIVWNRLNTALICFNWQLYQEIPHWKEVWVTITIFALYFIVYRFILYRLPILYQWQGEQ